MTIDPTLEKRIVDIEQNLSLAAAIPIVGQIAGALKIILGVIQSIGGLLGLILSAPFLWTKKGREFFCRSGSHFVNGIANIVEGALEATPLIGNIIGIGKWIIGFSRDPHIGGHKTRITIFGYRVLDQLDAQNGKRKYSNLAYLPL